MIKQRDKWKTERGLQNEHKTKYVNKDKDQKNRNWERQNKEKNELEIKMEKCKRKKLQILNSKQRDVKNRSSKK